MPAPNVINYYDSDGRVHYLSVPSQYTADPKQLVPQLEQLRDSLIGYQELKNHFDILIDKCTRAMPY